MLRLLRLEREFSPLNESRQTTDAKAMEQLTGSPYIPDIYTACGQSMLSEYMANDCLIPKIRKRYLSSVRRLKFATRLNPFENEEQIIDTIS